MTLTPQFRIKLPRMEMGSPFAARNSDSCWVGLSRSVGVLRKTTSAFKVVDKTKVDKHSLTKVLGIDVNHVIVANEEMIGSFAYAEPTGFTMLWQRIKDTGQQFSAPVLWGNKIWYTVKSRKGQCVLGLDPKTGSPEVYRLGLDGSTYLLASNHRLFLAEFPCIRPYTSNYGVLHEVAFDGTCAHTKPIPVEVGVPRENYPTYVDPEERYFIQSGEKYAGVFNFGGKLVYATQGHHIRPIKLPKLDALLSLSWSGWDIMTSTGYKNVSAEASDGGIIIDDQLLSFRSNELVGFGLSDVIKLM